MSSSPTPSKSSNISSQLAGHLLVQCLIAQGIQHVFGVPGESYLPVLDGMAQFSEQIQFITCRHEGGAAFMAEAAGKLGWAQGGKPGVCMVTRGPGATNAAIGLHTAFQDSTPMLLLVGDVGQEMRDREAFQEMDFFSFFAPMAKRVERIDDARRIPEYIARAFATALNGRPGPVVLILPEDMLSEQVNLQPLNLVQPVQAWSDPGALRSLRTMLLNSQAPIVIAGGGGWTPQAAQALQRFAENWQLPVANAFRFQDTFDNFHPNYAGDVGIGINPALARRIQCSDLVIAIGPRLGEITTGGYTLLQAPRSTQKLVHIHASAEELGRVYQADLAICATMNAAARSLEVLTAPVALPWSEQTRLAQAEYQQWIEPQDLPGLPFDTEGDGEGGSQGCINMPLIIKILQQHLPQDAVLTNGAGNYASWLHRYFQFTGLAHGAKTQVAPTSGSMGVGVPAAVAANVMTGRLGLTIAGDGDFLMTGQELSTATQHGAASIVIVLNNGCYGTIRMHQERHFPNRVSGSDIRGANFTQLAHAYGYHGARMTHTQEFEPLLLAALDRCKTQRQGSLIEIMISPQVLTTRQSLDAIRKQADSS